MDYKITDTKTFYSFFKDFIFNARNSKNSKNIISKEFKKKIILAVTQVNGCNFCSYVHSKHALKNGISQKEIDLLLSGDFGALSEQEAKAILFAQYYAESRASYDKEIYAKMETHLGKQKAKAVLGVIRKIMVANTYGIALELLQMRFSGKRDKQSHFVDEIGIVFGAFIMLPILLIQKAFK